LTNFSISLTWLKYSLLQPKRTSEASPYSPQSFVSMCFFSRVAAAGRDLMKRRVTVFWRPVNEFGGKGVTVWQNRLTILKNKMHIFVMHLFGLACVVINSLPLFRQLHSICWGVTFSWGEGLFTQWPLAQLSKGLPHCIHTYLQSGPGLNQTFDILIARRKPSNAFNTQVFPCDF